MRRIAAISFFVCFVLSCSEEELGGLDENSYQYTGEQLRIEPFYGWGWMNYSSDPFEVPAYFEIELEELFEFRNILRGGVGKIVSESHPLIGKWVVFSTRHAGPASLLEKGPHYNIDIFDFRPTKYADGWPIPEKGEDPNSISGFGFVYLLEDG